MTEKHREKQYMESLLEDLVKDKEYNTKWEYANSENDSQYDSILYNYMRQLRNFTFY